MRLKLRVVASNGGDAANGEAIFDLKKSCLLVGRSRADIPIPDKNCSDQHALFFESPAGNLCLRDLESRNGTFVDGIKIIETVVGPESEIKIGEVTIRLLEFEPAAPRAKSFGIKAKKIAGVPTVLPQESESVSRGATKRTRPRLELLTQEKKAPPEREPITYSESDLITKTGELVQGTEAIYKAMPKQKQIEFLDFVDEYGTETRERLSQLLKQKKAK